MKKRWLTPFSIWINFVPSLAISTGYTFSFKWSIQPSDYIDFLIRIFDLWLEKGNYGIKILPIETIICGFLEREYRDPRLVGECKKRLITKNCEKNLVIIPNGEIRTCGFHGYGDVFKFGNIEDGLAKVLDSQGYQKYKEHLNTIQARCSKCRWYRVCYNGCPRDFHIGGEEDIFCREFPRLFRCIQKGLEEYPISKEWFWPLFFYELKSCVLCHGFI